MNIRRNRGVAAAVAAVLAVSAGAPATLHAAEKQLEEVVVTAQRRTESLKDVPVSVAVVTGKEITDYSLQNLDQLSRYVPGFTVSEGGEQTSIGIRGFSTGLNFGFDQSVGMFVDGIYAGRERQFRGLFLDIGSVEVLKGPQATLFGKSTTAGAVIISTGKPTHQFSTELGAEYTPETQAQNYRAIINGGITDTLAGRLALRFSDSQGYMHNTFTGQREEQEQDWIARGTLLWEPIEGFSATLKVEHSKYRRYGRNFNVSQVDGLLTGHPTCYNEANRDPYCAARPVPPATTSPFPASGDVGPEARLSSYLAFDPNFRYNDYTHNSKQLESAHVKSDSQTLHLSYDLTSDTRISSITGYSAYNSNDQRDVDWTPTNYLFEPITERFHQISQEFQLTSKIGEKFEYIAGVHAFKNDFFVDRRTDIDINVFLLPFGARPFDPLPFGGPASAWRYANLRYLDQETKSASGYFSGTFHFTPQWHLNAGIRYNDERKTESDRVGISNFGSTRFLDVRPDPTDPLNANPANPTGRLLGNAADVAFVNNIRTVLPGNINGLIGANNSRIGAPDEVNSTDWSPEAKLSWNVTENNMLYTRYAHASKSGGFNSAVTGVNAKDRKFGPEVIDGYELGGKFRLFNNTVEINTALFRQELRHQQTSVWVGDNFFVGNAGSSRAQGLEADAAWQATDHLKLRTAFLYNDAKYIKYRGVACSINQRYFPNPLPGCVYTPYVPATGTTPQIPASYLQDLSGTRYSPTFGGTAGGEYSWLLPADLKLTWQANAVYTPHGVFVNDPTATQPSRTIVDTWLSLASGDKVWDVAVLVRNATDKKYYYYVFEAPAQIGTRIGFPAAPRTVTLQATYRIK